MRAMPDAFPHRRRLLQFLIAASAAALCAPVIGCANAKRPSSAFDYSRTAGDEKEEGSKGGSHSDTGNGGPGGVKRD
jgi:hypothetical protein